MRLTDASVAIRPRSAWEALDLGVLLARRHAGLLMASWALVSLPVFALLCLLLWDSPGWAMLAFWWLKPAFERLPLYILGRALFGDTPTLKQALKAWPGLLKPQLLASLTWRRLSPTRSFDLPVLQLEGLAGQARSARLAVLGQRDSAPATWLTLVGVHLEMALWLGLVSLFYLLLPQQIELDWSWQSLIQADAGDWLWLEHLSNLLYALVLVLWEPIYVACGFSLYLNRRTALEAWDIELSFRRLRQRLTGVAYALVLGLGLLLAQTPGVALAAGSSCPLPQEDPHGPEAPRLLQQPLTSQAAQRSIAQLLDEPPFEHRETVTLWRFGAQEAAEPSGELDLEALLEKLRALIEFWKHLDSVALFFEVLLWASLFALLAMLAWRYRDWLAAFAGRLGVAPRPAAAPPSQLFGLEVAPQSLPADVPGEAERLWAEQPRAALGLLYRALLSRLLHDYRLPLSGAHTEAEMLRLVATLEQGELDGFSRALTQHWQNLAYGHRLPPEELKAQLCDGWRRLFAGEVRP
ncbi:DUF4129 domain-containing protein [Pseudomonas sp. LPB0260]|uniref:DUF4129 domain-containing protein n=1 Tax=Pseudomonas sp. LPB0260 TaxID=2614442 RepID=UPI0015C25015|nr:DUF4129 domain-containing protein [Pseudomonas sp. LPB0260]QLC73904.1 DUF4129 domain-containing protein [Pseudomonas sp. LPB0260]QLC76678.1 DUF4129 domain-containing protein [Pseudomonas sp. LPB0260]